MSEGLLTKWYVRLKSSVIAFRETALRLFYRNFAALVFPHDFSGNLICDSNQLFLLEFLDTRLRGYNGIFLRFCTEFDIEKVCQQFERGL